MRRVPSQCAQCGPHVRQEYSGRDALAGDVDERHADAPVGKRQEVVVVASDLAGRFHGGVPVDAGTWSRQRRQQRRLHAGRNRQLRLRNDLLPLEIRQRDLCLTEPDPQPRDDDETTCQQRFTDPRDFFDVGTEDPIDEEVDPL